MQYLLSEDEYKALLKRISDAESKSFKLSKDELQKLCTKIANEMPIIKSWDRLAEPEPWGCMITEETPDENGYRNEWYCDDCPVQDICPYEYKEYSK